MYPNQSRLNSSLSAKAIDSNVANAVLDYMETTACALHKQACEIEDLESKLELANEQMANLVLENKKLSKALDLSLEDKAYSKYASEYSESSIEKLVKQLNNIGILKVASINDNVTAIKQDPNYALDLLTQVADMFADSSIGQDMMFGQKQAAFINDETNNYQDDSLLIGRNGIKLSPDVAMAKQKVAAQNKEREMRFLNKK